MIKKKTTTEIFQAHRKVMNPVDTLPMNIYLESAKREWVSVESLILELKQYLDDDINSPLEDCYLFSKIESLIKELKYEIN